MKLPNLSCAANHDSERRSPARRPAARIRDRLATRRRPWPLLIGFLALSGCDAPVEQAKAAPEPLPAAVCEKAKEAVAKLESGGALVLQSPTDAVMSQDAWGPTSPDAKNAMLSAIGLAATCAGEPQFEQEVTIHSEYGDLMARRVVKTSYSTAEALAQ